MKSGKIFILLIWATLMPASLLFAQFHQTAGPEGAVINAIINHNGTLLAGSWGSGIYRSTDGGLSWNKSDSGLNNSKYIYSFAEKDSVIFAGAGAVYKSTDNGVSWSLDFLNGAIYSLTISGNYIFAAIPSTGIFRSDLSGHNWVLKNNGLTNNLGVNSLVSNNSIIYAGAETGVFMSTDWGNNWTAAGLTEQVRSLAFNQSMIFAGTAAGTVYKAPVGSVNWSFSGNGMVLNGETIRALKVKGGAMYAGSSVNGVYRSDDNGNSWVRHDAGLNVKDVTSLEFLGTVLIAGTNGGGVFSFDSTGNSWIPKNTGITSTSVEKIITQGSDMYCGTYYSGIFASSDNGNTWSSRSSGLPEGPITALYQSGPNMFCGFLFGYGIYKSADQGQTWFHSGLTKAVSAMSELPGKLFAGASDGMYRSTDNGISWSASGSGLPSSSGVMSLLPFGTEIFAGLDSKGVYISTDGGNSWTARNNGISTLSVNSLIKKDTLLFAGTSNGVRRSIDHGEHWTVVNNGLSTLMITSMANVANGILAGTTDGLFFSENNGDTWTNVSAGLTDKNINDVAVIGDNVFVGLNFSGVWTTLLSTMTGVKDNADMKRITCYPNPAHDFLTVKSSDPGMKIDLIRVYDLLGNPVSTASPANVSQFELDIRSLPRGLFILVIRSNGNDQQMKFIVD